jgi:hypothetical protein
MPNVQTTAHARSPASAAATSQDVLLPNVAVDARRTDQSIMHINAINNNKNRAYVSLKTADWLSFHHQRLLQRLLQLPAVIAK